MLRRQVSVEGYGLEHLHDLDEPVLFAANHSSALDTPVVLATLPLRRRWRTAAAMPGGSRSKRLLAARRSLLCYPEGAASADGFVGFFAPAVAVLSIEHQVPVVPVGIRGTFAALPPGRSRSAPGRPRVSVRYGAPLRPRSGETADELTRRIQTAVGSLIAEDATSWWAAQRAAYLPAEPPPPASWRRIWAQSEALPPRAEPRLRIWRG